MKKLILFFLFILITVPLLAQPSNDPVWGEKILFGSTFVKTDSLRLKTSGLTDTLMADTLYSGGLDILPGEGIYGLAIWFEEVSGTSASISLDVRFGVNFRDPSDRNSINLKWDDWQHVKTQAKDTFTRMSIATSDSSWWNPAANVRQYRLREADADTVLHNVTDFIR